MRRQRVRRHVRVAQVVVAVDDGHQTRGQGESISAGTAGEARAVHRFVVLSNHGQRGGRQAHAAPQLHAMGHVVLVVGQVSGRKMFLPGAHALWNFELADVVGQGTHT